MRSHIIIFLSLIVCTLSKGQQIPPQAFNYSAIARNASSIPIASTPIGIQVSILKSSPTGQLVYSENHLVTTDAFGLFNLIIGGGSIQSGSMSSIDWGGYNHYLKIGIDVNGGNNFVTMGITQFLSVPYALYASTTDSLLNGTANETDPQFMASPASAITNSDRVAWDKKQNKIYVDNGISLNGDTISSNSAGGGGFSHYIGEHFGGGVIFHLWKDSLGNEHGLIVDIVDLAAYPVYVNWSNISNTTIGASAQSTWNGMANCNAIVGQTGHTSSAASLCLNSTNGGQNDWYLPSVDECGLLLKNRFNVSRTFASINGATYFNLIEKYWTSTEAAAGGAIAYSFGQGLIFSHSKASPYYIRAIREF